MIVSQYKIILSPVFLLVWQQYISVKKIKHIYKNYYERVDGGLLGRARQCSRLFAHLEETLHILQDVDPAVAEVVLLGHSRAGALHHLLAKAAL